MWWSFLKFDNTIRWILCKHEAGKYRFNYQANIIYFTQIQKVNTGWYTQSYGDGHGLVARLERPSYFQVTALPPGPVKTLAPNPPPPFVGLCGQKLSSLDFTLIEIRAGVINTNGCPTARGK